jgi:hypothetical protein
VPHDVDQPVDLDVAAGVEEQRGQDRPLSQASEWPRFAVAQHGQRPEHQEVQATPSVRGRGGR